MICAPCMEARQWLAMAKLPGQAIQSCLRMARRTHELCDLGDCECKHFDASVYASSSNR